SVIDSRFRLATRPIPRARQGAKPTRLSTARCRDMKDDRLCRYAEPRDLLVALPQRRPRRLTVEVAHCRAVTPPQRRICSRPLNAGRVRCVGPVEAFQQVLLVRFPDHEQYFLPRLRPIRLLFGIT